MIPGVVASQASGDDEETPTILLVDIQFDVGAAFVEGEAVSIASILGRPEFLIPGQGMVLGEGPACDIIGAPADIILLDRWTIVVDWNRPAEFILSTPLEINDGVEATNYAKIRIEDSEFADFFVFDSYHDPTAIERDIFGPDAPGPVSRAVAVRHTNERFTMSLDGAAVEVSDPDVEVDFPQMYKVWIGGNSTSSYGPVVVKRLMVFSADVMIDDFLPGLSVSEGLSVPDCDSFASALPLELGPIQIYVVTTGCSKESGEPDHGGEPGGASVWLEFTALESVDYTIRIWHETTMNEPIIAVYTGSAVGSLTPVASDVNNDWEVTFSATEGVSYKIALDGVDGEGGFFSVQIVDDVVAPTITSAAEVEVAESTTLSHTLTANEAVTWSIWSGTDADDFEISGSTLRFAGNATHTQASSADANGDNAYLVTVRATDAMGNTTNQSITVFVTTADGWVTVFGGPPALTIGGMANLNSRTLMDANFLRGSTNKVRITFCSSLASGPLDIQSASIGHRAASGNVWDFTGDQVAITFDSGSATKTIPEGLNEAVSDEITFSFGATDNLVVAIKHANVASSGFGGNPTTGNKLYTGGSGSDHSLTTAPSSYSQLWNNFTYGVTKIEVKA